MARDTSTDTWLATVTFSRRGLLETGRSCGPATPSRTGDVSSPTRFPTTRMQRLCCSSVGYCRIRTGPRAAGWNGARPVLSLGGWTRRWSRALSKTASRPGSSTSRPFAGIPALIFVGRRSASSWPVPAESPAMRRCGSRLIPRIGSIARSPASDPVEYSPTSGKNDGTSTRTGWRCDSSTISSRGCAGGFRKYAASAMMFTPAWRRFAGPPREPAVAHAGSIRFGARDGMTAPARSSRPR